MPNPRCWVGSTVDNDNGLNFGNVCYGVPGQGLTQGYWHNKNGKATITNGNCLAGVLGLPLRKADGTFLGSVNLAQFQSFLVSTSATNMANMLSSQLAAMYLNVNCSHKVAGTDLVYAPSLMGYPLLANSAGLVSINAIIAASIVELNLHPVTVASGADRTKQEALKTALDRGNNNLNWVGNATSCPAPDDWAIILPVVNLNP